MFHVKEYAAIMANVKIRPFGEFKHIIGKIQQMKWLSADKNDV
jgi:hypothetical protein